MHTYKIYNNVNTRHVMALSIFFLPCILLCKAGEGEDGGWCVEMMNRGLNMSASTTLDGTEAMWCQSLWIVGSA